MDVLSLSYAQHFSFLNNKLKIIPSVQVSYFNRRLDPMKLSFYETIDPRLGQNWTSMTALTTTRQNLDFSTGLLVNCKNYYFGAAVFHISRPNNLGFQELLGYPWPIRVSLHSSYNFHPTEKSLLQAMLRYDKQNNLHYIGANIFSLFGKHFITGAGYRWNNGMQDLNWVRSEVSVNAGLKTNFFTLGLGYDFGIKQDLTGFGPGSWELMMTFNFRKGENRKAITNFETW